MRDTCNGNKAQECQIRMKSEQKICSGATTSGGQLKFELHLSLLLFSRAKKQAGNKSACFLESRAVTCMFVSTIAFVFQQLFSRDRLEVISDIKYIFSTRLRFKNESLICQILCCFSRIFGVFFVTCERSTILANQETPLRSYLLASLASYPTDV